MKKKKKILSSFGDRIFFCIYSYRSGDIVVAGLERYIDTNLFSGIGETIACFINKLIYFTNRLNAPHTILNGLQN